MIKIKKTFITLSISFMLLSLFTSIVSNCYFIKKLLKDSYFLTVELQNEKSKEKIEDFEKFLLENKNINGVKFLDKDEAFRNLQKELEIIIPKSENPLSNAMIVFFKEEEKLSEIQELLDTNPIVREIYLDNSFLQNTKKKISAINMIMLLSSFFVLCIGFQITTILRGLVVRDYIILNLKNHLGEKNFEIARNRNLIPFLASSLLGVLLFFNIYIIFKEKVQEILTNLNFQSFNQMIYLILFINIFVLIFSWKNSKSLKRKEG